MLEILTFRGTLSQIRPCRRVVLKAMLGGSLGTPYYASAGSTGVKAGMGAMSFVGIAELAMDLGIQFATGRQTSQHIEI